MTHKAVSLAVLIVAISGATVTNSVGHAEAMNASQGTLGQRAEEIKPMSDDRFWALIEPTTAFENNPERQIASLHSALANLPIDEIEGFEVVFREQMTRSYSWDLWGATYVVHGGASDDGFEYFRCWLISKGRRIFEKVLADPDRLADVLAAKVEGVLEFEEFAYVARKVWGEKVGRPGHQMPNVANTIYPGPSGTKFDDGAADLAKRYPKLWRRFGTKPLG